MLARRRVSTWSPVLRAIAGRPCAGPCLLAARAGIHLYYNQITRKFAVLPDFCCALTSAPIVFEARFPPPN